MADLRSTSAPEEPRRAADRSVFRKDGDYWTIAYEGRAIRLKDAKGLHCLARLLRNPGREFHATDLVNVAGSETVGEEPVGSEQPVAADLGDAGEALDAQAKAEYRGRLADLRDELEEAERFNDTGRAAKVREEIEAITRELAAGVGLGGRDRPAASHAERARVTVTQRVRSSLAKIRESHPSLGRHLATTLKTGYFCSYSPDPAPAISWDDAPDEVGSVRFDDSRGGARAEGAEPASRQAPQGAERRLAAIFSADVAGFTRLMNEDEAATIRNLAAHRKRMAALIGERRGRVVDAPGDNVLAEFASAVDAVECAVGVQSALAAENAPLPPERRMEFRIGLNVGDVVAEGDRIYGDGVNVAARVERLAEAGGICVSGSVYDQVKSKLALAYEDLGLQALKNVPEPVRVYRVTAGLADARHGTVAVRAAKRRRRSALAIAAALLLLVAGLAARTWFGAPVAPWEHPLTLPDKPSIAILPFANLSGDPEQEYFTTGMTQDLIADASKLSGLFIIAHESVLPYKGKTVNVRDVGRDLGVRFVLEGSVRYVLEGSVRKAGDQIRITVRLTEATNGRQVWAERYDRQLKDTFALEDDILRHLIADLQVEVEGAELERIRLVPAQNLTAYESYLRGLDFAKQCTSTSVTQAREMFERAIDVEPNFAAAYAELGLLAVGEAYGPLAVDKLCALSGASPYRRVWWNALVPVLKRRDELAERALALDDSLPTAHILRGFLEPGTPQAIAEADRAIALGPGDARAHVLSAAIYSTAAKPQEAVTLLEKAIRMNPRYPDWYLFHLGRAYALMERYEDAAAALKRVVLSHPDFQWAHTELAAIYEKLDRQEAAKIEEAESQRLYASSRGISGDSYPRFVADGDEGRSLELADVLAAEDAEEEGPMQEPPATLGAPSAGVPLPSPASKGSMDWFFRLK